MTVDKMITKNDRDKVTVDKITKDKMTGTK